MQYNLQYSSNTWTLTNTLSVYTPSDSSTEYGTTIKGTINWKDESNKWQFRPLNIDILLYRNGVYMKKLTLDNNATSFEFTGLPKIDDDEESDTYLEAYNYEIKERVFDDYEIKYKTTTNVTSTTDGLGNVSKTSTTYVDISNIFKPIDNKTIRTNYRNKLSITPIIYNLNNEEASVDDFDKIKTAEPDLNLAVKLKQLNTHWNAIDAENGRYSETYSGYSGIEVNGIFNMDRIITFDYILCGKYEIVFGNDSIINFTKLKKLASENATFSYEDGRYYVTYSYLYDSSYVNLQSDTKLDSWAGYTSRTYRLPVITNIKTK